MSSATQLGIALKLGGIEPSEVELIELGLPEMVAALSNKAIDGATLLEPFVTLAVAKHIAVRWKGMEEFLPFKGQNGVIIYSQKFAARAARGRQALDGGVSARTRAYIDSVVHGTDRDAINAILVKHTAVKDPALYAKMAPTGFDPDGRLEMKSLEADQDWFMKLGLQKERADLSKSRRLRIRRLRRVAPGEALRHFIQIFIACPRSRRTPSPQGGEGWGEGVRASPIASEPPHPAPPRWGEGEESVASAPSFSMCAGRGENASR